MTRLAKGAIVSVSCPVATSQIADDERGIDQSQNRPQVERVAKQIAPQVVPVARCGCEELL